MNRLQVIQYLVEDTDNLIHKRKEYEHAREDFRDYVDAHGGFSSETFNKAYELFPAYSKASEPSKASIQANLKMIRRLSMEEMKEVE